MAHGYLLATGRPQAVMVHVNVGLANTVMGVINAARDNVPLLLLSGRTPAGEGGRTGSRDLPIHWGQEMRDQGAMVRELVKWDYELRLPEQVPELIDRALAIAMSPPMGPVYLSLPREVLCSAVDGLRPAERAAPAPAATAVPAPAALDEAAALIAAAERPLILTQRAGAFAGGFDALADFAQRFALPVVEFWPSRISLSVDHPMHAGFDPSAALAQADLVVVLDALTPWIPLRHELPPRLPRHPARPRPTVRGDAGARLSVRSGAGRRRRGQPGPARRRRWSAGWPRVRANQAGRRERLAVRMPRPARRGSPPPTRFRACRCPRPSSAAGSPRRCPTTPSCSPNWAATPR